MSDEHEHALNTSTSTSVSASASSGRVSGPGTPDPSTVRADNPTNTKDEIHETNNNQGAVVAWVLASWVRVHNPKLASLLRNFVFRTTATTTIQKNTPLTVSVETAAGHVLVPRISVDPQELMSEVEVRIMRELSLDPQETHLQILFQHGCQQHRRVAESESESESTSLVEAFWDSHYRHDNLLVRATGIRDNDTLVAVVKKVDLHIWEKPPEWSDAKTILWLTKNDNERLVNFPGITAKAAHAMAQHGIETLIQLIGVFLTLRRPGLSMLLWCDNCSWFLYKSGFVAFVSLLCLCLCWPSKGTYC